MVVEDINRSEQPISLIERLLSWSSKQNGGRQTTRWQIFCPVWPPILMALADQPRNKINDLVLSASSFSAEAGTGAVRRRCELSKVLTNDKWWTRRDGV